MGASFSSAASALTPERSPVELTRMSVASSRVTAPLRGGDTAELTLAPGLETAANRLLLQARPVEGAVVALDPRTGRVLVWSEVRRRGAGESVVTAAREPAASVFKQATANASATSTFISATSRTPHPDSPRIRARVSAG